MASADEDDLSRLSLESMADMVTVPSVSLPNVSPVKLRTLVPAIHRQSFIERDGARIQEYQDEILNGSSGSPHSYFLKKGPISAVTDRLKGS